MGESALGLRVIRSRLDELAELRLGGLTHAEQLEYLELVCLEGEAIAARDSGSADTDPRRPGAQPLRTASDHDPHYDGL